jgi:Asp-tRNA(Asn)/Glu-tRNA(Gln) amidotransferase A subunit family amidase
MAAAYRSALERLRKAGLTIKLIDIASFTDLNQHQRTVMFYEGARFHEERYKQYGDRLDSIAELVRDGLKITADQYNDALRQIAKGRALIASICRDTPIILSPAATGPAPLGLSDTGNAAMNGPWSAMGQPTISIPMPVGNMLPLGLQIAGDLNQDARVLQAGVHLEKILGNTAL